MNKNNILLIDKLFISNICFVEEISVFLGSSLLENWKMLKSATSELKYSRSLTNIKNNLTKLSKLEFKRPVVYSKTISNNKKILNEYDVDKDYRSFINKKLKSISYVYELYEFLVFEYDKYREKIIIDTKEEPKHVIRYVVDDKGDIYVNMEYINQTLVFVRSSLLNEKWRFYNSLKKNKPLDLSIPEEYGTKISPLEKKRRIYINTMFDLYRSLNILARLKTDIYYPIFLYFVHASTLVSYLYKEIFEYSRKDVYLNRLWQETIKAYGCSNGIEKYEKIYWNFINNLDDLPKELKVDYVLKSDKEKSKRSNQLFRDIEGLVPSVADIYKAFSNLVLNKVANNYDFYVTDLENRVKNSIKYMSVEDMVAFYDIFKAVLKRNGGKVELYVRLQKVVATMIKDRNNMNVDDVITKYFKEEIL